MKKKTPKKTGNTIVYRKNPKNPQWLPKHNDGKNPTKVYIYIYITTDSSLEVKS